MTKSYYNMITIQTHVTNPLYFLIINLYKYTIFIKIKNKKNNAHNQY